MLGLGVRELWAKSNVLYYEGIAPLILVLLTNCWVHRIILNIALYKLYTTNWRMWLISYILHTGTFQSYYAIMMCAHSGMLTVYFINTHSPSWKSYLFVVFESVSSLGLVWVVGDAYPWGQPLLLHLLTVVGGHDVCAPWSVTLSLSCTP